MLKKHTLIIAEVDVYFRKASPFQTPCGAWSREANQDDFIIEKRYIIPDHYGIPMGHESIYLRSTCNSTSRKENLVQFPAHPTRQFKREVDKLYFKFFDDAEEVRNNLFRMIEWLEDLQKKAQTESQKKHPLMEQWIRDVSVHEKWEKMKASMIGLPVRRRSDLSPLQRDFRDSEDLVEQ